MTTLSPLISAGSSWGIVELDKTIRLLTRIPAGFPWGRRRRGADLLAGRLSQAHPGLGCRDCFCWGCRPVEGKIVIGNRIMPRWGGTSGKLVEERPGLPCASSMTSTHTIWARSNLGPDAPYSSVAFDRESRLQGIGGAFWSKMVMSLFGSRGIAGHVGPHPHPPFFDMVCSRGAGLATSRHSMVRNYGLSAARPSRCSRSRGGRALQSSMRVTRWLAPASRALRTLGEGPRPRAGQLSWTKWAGHYLRLH